MGFKIQTDYFLRKKFSKEQLAVVMKKAPQLFSRTVESIDARLGFFQTTFFLTGDQIRETVVEHPELFRFPLSHVKRVNFHMNKFLGFKPNEIRELFITVPSIFFLKRNHLERRFDQLHNTMMIPHQSLVKFPYLLKVPFIVVRQRHLSRSSVKEITILSMIITLPCPLLPTMTTRDSPPKSPASTTKPTRTFSRRSDDLSVAISSAR